MAAGQSSGTMNAGRIVQVKKVSKAETITGLSIPQVSNALQFRTKANTLVATGYVKVQRDEDGVVCVYFKGANVYERNLVEIESGRMALNGIRTEVPAVYNSKDSAKVEFLRPSLLLSALLDAAVEWKAPAADLYVNGLPVYKRDSVPESGPKSVAKPRQT